MGVSNFLERHIEAIEDNANVPVMVNQIEVHPFFQEEGLINWCHKRGIVVQGWGTTAQGKIFKDGTMSNLSSSLGKSPVQITLRWEYERNIIPIISGDNESIIRDNMNIWDFNLTEKEDEDIKLLNSSSGHRDLWMYNRQQMY